MPLRMSAKAKRFMDMPRRADEFAAVVPQIAAQAAKAATDESRVVFQRGLSNRPPTTPRRGRKTPHGAFKNAITWTSTGDWVNFDSKTLRKIAAAYWLIQEIGTGQSATILNPGGTVHTPSQYGRQISAFLFWAPGPGGNAQRPQTGATRDQLYLAREINTSAYATHDRNGVTAHRRMRIRREVKGKHFIKFGGFEGFTVLAEGLIGEAKRIFK